MAVVAIGAPLLLPEHRDSNAGRLDLLSVALLLATLLPFVYGIKSLAKDDPPAIALVTIGAGVVFGLWFVVRQLRSDAPVLDVRLFANRTVSGALAVFILAATGLGGCICCSRSTCSWSPGSRRCARACRFCRPHWSLSWWPRPPPFWRADSDRETSSRPAWPCRWSGI
jgi:hypothetical protein